MKKLCDDCYVDMTYWDDGVLIYELVESDNGLYWTTESHNLRHVKWLCENCATNEE